MGYNNDNNLKFIKSRDRWESGSLTIFGNLTEAWSYNELIMLVKDDFIFFNSHHFSVTTTRHQDVAYWFFKDRLKDKKIIKVDLSSMNNLRVQKLNKNFWLALIDESTKILDTKFYPKYCKSAINKKIESINEFESKYKLDKSINELERRIINLSYSSQKGLKKAIETFKEHKPNESLKLLFDATDDRIKIFESLIRANFDLTDNYTKNRVDGATKTMIFGELGD